MVLNYCSEASISRPPDSLFSASASLERKSWGFQLFSKALKTWPTQALAEICSPNLMRCLVNQRNDPERYLHDAAKCPLDDMRARVKKEPAAAVSLLKGIFNRNRIFNFDQATKTKTIENIVCSADDSALCEIVAQFQVLVYDSDMEDISAKNSLRTIADLLLSLIRSRVAQRSIPDDAESSTSWLGQILLLMVDVTYFASPSSADGHQISVESRALFQSRLSSSLSSIVTSKLDPQHTCPVLVVSTVRKKADSGKSLLWRGDEEITKVVRDGHRELDELVERVSSSRHLSRLEAEHLCRNDQLRISTVRP